MTFHNGQPFEAEDVKYTFERILNPASASPNATIFASIKAVTVLDPLTVRFELHAPNAAFLSYMATNPNGVIVPRGVTDLAPAANVPAYGALAYVAAVNIIIWAGIFFYLVYLDRKVRAASRHLSPEERP